MQRIYIEKIQLDMPSRKELGLENSGFNFSLDLKAGFNFIHGNGCVGKTHLLSSLAKYLKSLKSDEEVQTNMKVTFPNNDTILAKQCMDFAYIPDYTDAPLNTEKLNMESRYEGLQIATMSGRDIKPRKDVIPPINHNTSPLLVDLQWAIFGGKSLCVFIYEMGEMYANSGFKGTLEDMKERYEYFKYAADYYLGASGKRMHIDSDIQKPPVYFTQNNSSEILELSDLSSTEKKVLLLLTTALTLNNSDSIFICDMPFKGLEGICKTKLIGHLSKLSPNCQFIFTVFNPNTAMGCDKDIEINRIQLPDFGLKEE